MTVPRTYRVADVARVSGVSIRALHHYDAIGLLVPTGRTEAGYRLYTDADLLRLQQILIGRELGFSLDEIKRSLDDPRFDHRQALIDQRRRLEAKARALDGMLHAVDAALAVVGRDPHGGAMDIKDLFEGFDPSAYEAEAEERWGDDGGLQGSPLRRVKALHAPRTGSDSRPSRRRSTRMPPTRCAAASSPTCAGRPGDRRAASAVDRPLVLSVRPSPCTPGWRTCTRPTTRFRASIDAPARGSPAFWRPRFGQTPRRERRLQ